MKGLKILLVTITAMTILLGTQSAMAAATGGTSGLLKSIQGPGFEIFNKAPQTISVALVINGDLTTANVGSKQKFLKTVDLKDTIRLGIFDKQTQNISTAFLSGAITPQPDRVYDLNAPAKTKYVTWNPAKAPYLYPQTGTIWGLSGKSDSGYPLGANLQQSQIIPKK